MELTVVLRAAMNWASVVRQVKTAASPGALVAAVQRVAEWPEPSQAIPLLIEVLGYNNPAAAQVAIASLQRWGRQAVPDLLTRLDGYNYGARAYAVRVLAHIGDPRALEVLEQAARYDFAPSVRRAAIRGLGNIQWQELATPEPLQERVAQALRDLSGDGDWGIRYAVIVAWELWHQRGLPGFLQPQMDALLQQLAQDEDRVVQARAQWVLQRSDKYVTMPKEV
ncbi:MAG: HEAT repeat domain-containing protein [Gloeomargarita sp. SKYG116]|nr:HEAT repeat domain-containing protein [Gloeomargarita sp. SKYG116]MDW8400443.1 HEAT repeat domain-containing protein [Gloeomargarita sp. SKYGB_i_bin116]